LGVNAIGASFSGSFSAKSGEEKCSQIGGTGAAGVKKEGEKNSKSAMLHKYCDRAVFLKVKSGRFFKKEAKQGGRSKISCH